MARSVFWLLAILAMAAGLYGDFVAKTAIHQILAQINYLIAAVLAVGAEIIASIGELKPKPAEPKPEASQSSDMVVL